MSRLVASQRAWLAPSWVREDLSRKAQALPSLDLRFAESKSLTDAASGANLVTFTRSSSGTYVGSDGVLQRATTNLLLRSEEIGASPWGTNNAGATTYTANAIAAPTGTVTADRVTATADFAGPNQFVSATSGLSYSLSFCVKAVTPGSLDSIRIECFSGRFATFNMTTRVFSGVNAAITPSSVSLSDGWVRVQCLFAAPTTGSLAVSVYASTSSDFYLWGAQLEQSSTVGEYIPTTSTINSAPRFDHNPTTGESLGLLVEESRTNLLVRSEEFDNASWVKTGLTVTTNSDTSPDGQTTADTLTVGGTGQSIYQSATVTTSTSYTGSAYIKLGTLSAASYKVAVYDNTNAAFIATDIVPAQTPTSTGWTRISYTFTTPATCTSVRWYPFRNSGNVSGTVLVWGAQLEAGAFPTSYIPTTTAAATRSADVASITGTNFSSWYRQDTGTFFADATLPYTVPGTQFPFLSSANDGTTANRVDVGYLTPNVVGLEVATGGVAQASIYPNISSAISSRRVAGTYALNDFAVAANTTSVGTDTSGTVPTVTQLRIGDRTGSATAYSNGTIRRLTYWPARLANSTLQQITQ